MTVRLLTDDVTGGPQVAGMVGRVERKESDTDGNYLFWVAMQRKRRDGETITDRAPYYAEDLELVIGGN